MAHVVRMEEFLARAEVKNIVEALKEGEKRQVFMP